MNLGAQQARVLAKARSYDGVCATDFLLPNVIDGGPPITRVAARLHELDGLGYSFECLGRRNKCKIFRLLSEPEGAVNTITPAANPSTGNSGARKPGVDGPASSEQGVLFDSPSRPHWQDAA